MKTIAREASIHRFEVLAACGLASLYFAVMSGHLMSIDGLGMWRQAVAITYHHSWSLVPPIWWGSTITTSARGIGASLEYVPSLLAFSWLSGHIPPGQGDQYDYRLLYGDILYIVAGAPVWVIITSGTAYLVALTSRALGADRSTTLWAIAFYGLGSPAFAASRGDWPQPVVALCWVGGMWACLRFKESNRQRWLWISALSLFYGVLTRPLEGSMLLPAELLLLWPRVSTNARLAVAPVGAWVLAVLATLFLNWARFGSPMSFGYHLGSPEASWTTPIWIGLPSVLLSPGRGVLWEFPAMVLAVPGTMLLWRRGNRVAALALSTLPAALLVESSLFTGWPGGWDWGFRFFQPALPLVAILAGIGVTRLSGRARFLLPPLLLAGGVLWNIPAIATDLLGGYGSTYAEPAANYRLDAYPPIGAWRFLHHIRPDSGSDGSAVDIVWFRATRIAGWLPLVPFGVLMATALTLWSLALRAARWSSLGPSEAGELIRVRGAN